MTSDQTKNDDACGSIQGPRRWQFGLRTMFIVVSIVSLECALARWHMRGPLAWILGMVSGGVLGMQIGKRRATTVRVVRWYGILGAMAVSAIFQWIIERAKAMNGNLMAQMYGDCALVSCMIYALPFAWVAFKFVPEKLISPASSPSLAESHRP